MAKKITIVLCSSANFYEHAHMIAQQLRAMGYKTMVPVTLGKMKKTKNFNADDYRIWYKDPSGYKRKTYLMRNHFDKIVSGDAILVVNDEKRGIKGYIGANVLMEMGLAFHLRKPIFVLNNVHEDMPVYEEIRAMNCLMLNGNLDKIKL
ncbi:hypothetical protein COU91_00705 [Candidatus Saccharibacteria bacterium CG10_big_fil_rev_8_21_14_0_10_47_8]|nr:MAG: hypothetical protein COU91_00705 [Candidatus Saccharibacteria bacterium CG10_big_fil_rev_8_21_14_0_10_47_8]